MNYECGGKKLFSCYICQKQFVAKINFKMHLINVHKTIN